MKRVVTIVFSLFFVFSLSACAHEIITPDLEGNAIGLPGSIMRTYNFDFTLDNFKATRNYEGIVPDQADQLIVLTMTIRNTTGEPLSVMDTYFQLQWGVEGFADSVGKATDSLADIETVLQPGQKLTLAYAFPAPKEITIFSLSFLDNKHLLPGGIADPSLFLVEFEL